MAPAFDPALGMRGYVPLDAPAPPHFNIGLFEGVLLGGTPTDLYIVAAGCHDDVQVRRPHVPRRVAESGSPSCTRLVL